ncbi:hypothetical protein BY458DRAFT_491958 [Sporodiniella umbellata]|nr:hypothetical protein BY458DRAFT_491956 [Sporodiniella umbellata]KAI9259280.1 hypothetical protein BY458DRAFT_491958 [Sporodiniella umbellata]
MVKAFSSVRGKSQIGNKSLNDLSSADDRLRFSLHYENATKKDNIMKPYLQSNVWCIILSHSMKSSVYSFIGVYLYISLYWLLVRATGVFLLKQLGITQTFCTIRLKINSYKMWLQLTERIFCFKFLALLVLCKETLHLFS